eukprot:6110512-Pyramimonas_sp.AAC.1
MGARSGQRDRARVSANVSGFRSSFAHGPAAASGRGHFRPSQPSQGRAGYCSSQGPRFCQMPDV